MKKKMILIISLMLFVSMMWGQIISQYVETNSGTTPKGVEIYNNTLTELDFSINSLVIEKGNNGGTPSAAFTLSNGTLSVGAVIVIGTSDLQSITETNGSIFHDKGFTFNGDDALVVKYGGVITDMFGTSGIDPGSAWTGSGVSTRNQNIQLKNDITTGDTDGWTDPSVRFTIVSSDPVNDMTGFGLAPNMGGNELPTISNVSHSPTGDILATTTVSVSADVTDGDGTISLVELHWGTTSGSLGNTITMSNGGSGATYTTSTDIPAQTSGTVYYEIYAEDSETTAGTSTSSEYNYSIVTVETTTIPYLEEFDSNLGQCYTNSVSGETKEWIWNSSGYANMNGYNSGDTEEDWLVLPGIDLDNYSDEIMTFDTWYNFGADEDANHYFELLYSVDYSGIGDPTGSTWTELNFIKPSSSSSWTASGDVDLSAITGSSVYIAFKYNYEVDSYRSWSVDNISINEVSAPTITVTAPNGGESYEIGSTASITWDYSGFTAPGTVKVDIYFNGVFVRNLVASTANDGQGSGVIPNEPILVGNAYKIRITSIEQQTIFDESDAVFSITEETVAADFVMINEVDVDQTSTDSQEFVELYDGGAGNTSLDGLVLVLFNGSDDQSYLPSVDLDSYSTDVNGYFVIGSATVPNVDLVAWTSNGLQNGADAVTLFAGDATDFPNDTAITTNGLIDAIVYGTGDGDDAALLVLLNAGQPQVDESMNDTNDTHSMQRLPNGSGGMRNTSTYGAYLPTPGVANFDSELPVTLSSFTAIQTTNDFVQLNWDVESESNLAGYYLYRSLDDSDALQQISDLIDAENLPYHHSYSFTDYELDASGTYFYYLESVELDGSVTMYDPISCEFSIEDGEETPDVPVELVELSNYPNPFNPSTTINFSVNVGETATLTIHNAKGQVIVTEQFTGKKDAYSYHWNGEKFGSGVYLYRLSTPSKNEVKKMIMMK